MSQPYCYEFPRPAVTVDLVAFARLEGGWHVLLIRRRREPFAGRWAIPGGFLDMEETAVVGARRELCEETGMEHDGPIALLGVYDALGRDPRGRTISLAYVTKLEGPPPEVKGGDDASKAAWVDVAKVDRAALAFDHAQILEDGLKWLGAQCPT